MAASAEITPLVEVSWDGSGDYTGDFDDVTNDVAASPGITIDEGRDGTRALSPPKVNAFDFELHNEGRAYSQENPGSPIYQRVLTNRPVRISALHGDGVLYRADALYRADGYYRGQGVYRLATGTIDDVAQTTAIGAQRVRLSNLAAADMLIDKKITIGLRTNIRTDEAFTELLDVAGWPAAKRDITPGDTTLLYWWVDERQPWACILELLAAEGPGAVYVDGDGVIHFEGRNYRTITARSMTSQASFSDLQPDADALWFTALNYDPGFKNLINRATYATKRRALGSLTKVWEYGASLTLSSNQIMTLIARSSEPFQNAIVPQDTVDYAVSAGSVSLAMDDPDGLVAVITLSAGASGATVDGVTSEGIQLRAEPLAVLSETTVQNSTDASTSIATYGERTHDVPGWPEIDAPAAEAVCNAWVSRYMVQRPQVTAVLRNADGNHVEQQLRRQVSDRIRLTETNTGLDADVWIESKRTTIAGAGAHMIQTELICEMAAALSGAVWDVSEWDDPAAVWGE
jgi:hypothetical protein